MFKKKAIIGSISDGSDHIAIMKEAGLESWVSPIQVHDFLLFIYHLLSERISGNL